MKTFWDLDKCYYLNLLTVGNEIRKVTLELWNSDWCGTDDGPTFEIRTQKGETRRVTRSFSPANLGDTLQWDNFNGKLGNGIDNSGNVSGLKVSGASLRFKLIGQSWDDFCPKRFKVVTYDGTVYRSSEMNDWVDKGKGNHYRTAYKV